MSTRGSRKRLSRQIEKHGPEAGHLIHEIHRIHSGMDLFGVKTWKIVDRAQSQEARKVLETEAVRALRPIVTAQPGY
ncbi:MAG: hypothetical protein ACLP3B_03540 [Syntrophobacteraceae bacterium]